MYIALILPPGFLDLVRFYNVNVLDWGYPKH